MTNTKLHSANLLGLDYAREAVNLERFDFPIVDVHTHLSGDEAARVYQRAANLYGIGLTYSMTPLDKMDAVQSVLGDAVQFIAIPDYGRLTSANQLGEQYARQIERLYKEGVRVAKFWSAPRRYVIEKKAGLPGAMSLDSPHILESMATAAGLGMAIMVHIGDPDTWFATKYSDSNRYGTKREQYEPLETVLERFDVPFIAAHMGGSPEDLNFLSDLLDRHPNLYLDTSATKWMVRELSKHPRAELVGFFRRWHGRILFGSDIVTSNKHLHESVDGKPDAGPAHTPDEAFALYASRYWALRTLLETRYVGQSPIADPDLAMLNPEQYNSLSAPQLNGMHLPALLLKTLMHDAAKNLFESLEG